MQSNGSPLWTVETLFWEWDLYMNNWSYPISLSQSTIHVGNSRLLSKVLKNLIGNLSGLEALSTPNFHTASLVSNLVKCPSKSSKSVAESHALLFICGLVSCFRPNKDVKRAVTCLWRLIFLVAISLSKFSKLILLDRLCMVADQWKYAVVASPFFIYQLLARCRQNISFLVYILAILQWRPSNWDCSYRLSFLLSSSFSSSWIILTT